MIILALGLGLILAWTGFALLTRNGRRLAYVTLVALHRLLVPESGERGLNEPAGVRDALRAITASTWWQARNLAGQPRLWRIEHAIRVRGCLPAPEDLPARVRHPDAEEAPVPAPSSPGRALALTAPQAELREQLEPLPAARPYVSAGEGFLS